MKGAWHLLNSGSAQFSSFCDLCVRLIRLFAYRFGVFRLAERAWWWCLGLVFGYLQQLLALLSSCWPKVFASNGYTWLHFICSTNNCIIAMRPIEFEFIGQAFSLWPAKQSKQLTKRKYKTHKFQFATISHQHLFSFFLLFLLLSASFVAIKFNYYYFSLFF